MLKNVDKVFKEILCYCDQKILNGVIILLYLLNIVALIDPVWPVF